MTRKPMHPFDLYSVLQRPGACEDVFRIGREKVTVAVAGSKPYSYWAEVYLVNGEARTITTTVDAVLPESKETFADYYAHARNLGWPPTEVSFSQFEPTAPLGLGLEEIAPIPPADVIRQRLITIMIIYLLGFSFGLVIGLAIRWPF